MPLTQKRNQKKVSLGRETLLDRLCQLAGAVFVLGLLFSAPLVRTQASAVIDDVTQEEIVDELEEEEVAELTEEEIALQSELNKITAEIVFLRNSLRDLRDHQDTIEDRIKAISTEIRRTELSIARSEIAIRSLGYERDAIEAEIAIIEEGVTQYQVSIAELIRSIATADDVPLVAVLLAGGSLSEITVALEESHRVQEQLLNSVGGLREAQDTLAKTEEELRSRQLIEERARSLLVIAREDLLVKKVLEGRLIEESEAVQEEAEHELSTQRLDAARVRNQLFPLADTDGGLTFEEAYLLAEPLALRTGIRTAFLLAILQKETHLGELKGTGTWSVDMHPRDWEAFFIITQELGLNPDEVSVSRKPSYGWGGALGPAQFLPATWLSYRERVAIVTGHNPPSPWNIEDAFAAAAVKLSAGGADVKTASAEWKAAMLYFAGGNWDNPAYAFYGDAVEDLTAEFAGIIEILEADTTSDASEVVSEGNS